MPKRKAPPRRDMTTEEAIRALFPKKVIDWLDEEIRERDEKTPKVLEKPEKSRKK